MGKKVNCTECLYFVREDAGYSNYTVEETNVGCLHNLNPNLPSTESYSWETKQAEQVKMNCTTFEKARDGEQIRLDVDREEGNTILDYTTSLKLQLILRLKYPNATSDGYLSLINPE